MGVATETRRAGIDALEIDEDVPESAAKATNRRPINNMNDGDDGSRSETPETFKAKHMQRRVGPASKKSSTVAPQSCVSRESPAAACRLARTERQTAKTPTDHASIDYRRDRSSGSRTVTPGDGHG